MPDRLSRELRDAVAARAGHRCEYCGAPARYCPDPLSVEHIVPRACGGAEELSNLALACQGCNNHFAWSADFALLLGKTPIGRATVERLRLNRPGIVNLRRVLRLIRNHPFHTESET